MQGHFQTEVSIKFKFVIFMLTAEFGVKSDQLDRLVKSSFQKAQICWGKLLTELGQNFVLVWVQISSKNKTLEKFQNSALQNRHYGKKSPRLETLSINKPRATARNLSVQAEVEVAMEDKTDLKIGFPASPGSRWCIWFFWSVSFSVARSVRWCEFLRDHFALKKPTIGQYGYFLAWYRVFWIHKVPQYHWKWSILQILGWIAGWVWKWRQIWQCKVIFYWKRLLFAFI